jgi:cell division septation protein DedD
MEKEEERKEKKEKGIYCPICNGPAEETGKPTWAYCTTHGWVKYKSHDEKESEDLLSKINFRASVLSKQTEEKIDGIRKKSPLIGYIVPAIFVTVLIGFLAGSFFWRDTANKSPEVRQTELPDQKEVPSQKIDQTIDTQPLVSVSPNEPVTADLNEKKEDKTEKKIEEKSIQSRKLQQTKQLRPTTKTLQSQQTTKPSKPVFTVQAGLFQNALNAKNLKEILLEKGYDASIITSKSKKGETLYRVYIGKFSERKKADGIVKKIRRETGLQAFVTVR